MAIPIPRDQKRDYKAISETNPMKGEERLEEKDPYLGLLTTEQVQSLKKKYKILRKQVEEWINGAIPQLLLGALLMLSLFMADAW
jgi:hypothetical protein